MQSSERSQAHAIIIAHCVADSKPVTSRLSPPHGVPLPGLISFLPSTPHSSLQSPYPTSPALWNLYWILLSRINGSLLWGPRSLPLECLTNLYSAERDALPVLHCKHQPQSWSFPPSMPGYRGLVHSCVQGISENPCLGVLHQWLLDSEWPFSSLPGPPLFYQAELWDSRLSI